MGDPVSGCFHAWQMRITSHCHRKSVIFRWFFSSNNWVFRCTIQHHPLPSSESIHSGISAAPSHIPFKEVANAPIDVILAGRQGDRDQLLDRLSLSWCTVYFKHVVFRSKMESWCGWTSSFASFISLTCPEVFIDAKRFPRFLSIWIDDLRPCSAIFVVTNLWTRQKSYQNPSAPYQWCSCARTKYCSSNFFRTSVDTFCLHLPQCGGNSATHHLMDRSW